MIIPITLAVVFGAFPVLSYIWKSWRGGKASLEPDPFPADGVWTLDMLKKFDGQRNPICLGVCGKVVDCSTSENIKYGEGYGKLWSGSDATYALATLSLNGEDANKMDFKLSDFTPDQHKALAGWYKHFTTKYTIVGKLAEYDGWDFSSVEEEAKSQTPFGAKKTEDDAPAVPEAAAPAVAAAAKAKAAAKAAAAKPEDDQLVLAKGETVKLKNMEGREELNGTSGVLQTYDAKKGGFEILMDGTGETVIAKPTQLTK